VVQSVGGLAGVENARTTFAGAATVTATLIEPPKRMIRIHLIVDSTPEQIARRWIQAAAAERLQRLAGSLQPHHHRNPGVTLMPPRDSSPGARLPPDACTPGPADMSGETSHDAVAELLRAFPRWAMWVPSENGEWTALRPASDRPPSLACR
jgi:hypothetical protein